jgi:hypothetical protein
MRDCEDCLEWECPTCDAKRIVAECEDEDQSTEEEEGMVFYQTLASIQL